MTRRYRKHSGGLGALVMPSNYDAQIVVAERMEPDGSRGFYVGDYKLTQQDLQNLEAWRQAGIAERQRQYDIEAAKRALELASQPAAPGWASAGPGAPVSSNPGAALALNYAGTIADPAGRSQVVQAVNEMISARTSQITPRDAATTLPVVTSGGGASYYPATGSFPEVGADSAGQFGPQENVPASPDYAKYLLAALGALALFQ